MSTWDTRDTAAEDDPVVTGALTVEPFTSLAPHYGMLLGVADFQTIAGNPRGKLRLHQAWQHGPGVSWGLGVELGEDRHSLLVRPGLAVDELGREVTITAEMCLDLPAWVQERSGDGKPFPPGLHEYRFSARLWLEHDACPTRKVPSVRSSCAQTDDSVQYSRVHEFGRLELEAYRPGVQDCYGDQEESEGDDGSDRDASFVALRALVRGGVVPDLPRRPTGWLDAFRSVAAVESAGLRAGGGEGTSAFPGSPFAQHPAPRLLLADLPEIVLTKQGQQWVATVGVIDLSVRRTHLPTWQIEELIAESLAGTRGTGPASDAGGPRVSRVTHQRNQVTIELVGDVYQETVTGALEVRTIDRSAPRPGWSDPVGADVTVTRSGPGRPARIVLTLRETTSPDVFLRVLLRGTGPTPLVGPAGGRPVPLAGRTGGPACSADDGCDVVAMIQPGGEL